jgi:MYXO-CTERM domain-containing protein
LIDIFPTVFQWLDMDVDEALDGESLLDLVSSVAVAPAARSLLAVQRPAITYFRDGDTDTSIYGLRDGDYKLLRSDTGGVTAAWELYDLAVDPDEQYDICEVETDMAELLSADIDNVLSGRDLGTGQDKTTPVGAGGCRAGNGQGGWTWGALLAGAALVRLFRRRRT